MSKIQNKKMVQPRSMGTELPKNLIVNLYKTFFQAHEREKGVTDMKGLFALQLLPPNTKHFDVTKSSQPFTHSTF